jgi:hypothetical protein
VQLSAEQVDALKAGLLYLQIYSEKGVMPDHSTCGAGSPPRVPADERNSALLIKAAAAAAVLAGVGVTPPRSRSHKSRPLPAAPRSSRAAPRARRHAAPAPGRGPAGPEFIAKWGERNTSDLLAQASATMPPDRLARSA